MALAVRYILLVLAASVLNGPAHGQTPSAVDRGRVLLEANCSRCHAIGKSGASSHDKAPPFRILNRRYPVESLAESLAEGIVTGHSDMPRFVFESPDVNAIIAYLKSIAE